MGCKGPVCVCCVTFKVFVLFSLLAQKFTTLFYKCYFNELLVRALDGQKNMFTILRGNFIFCLYCTFGPNKYNSVCWTR